MESGPALRGFLSPPVFLTGLAAYLASSRTAIRADLGLIGGWCLFLSEYMLFRGASLQWEACSSALEIRAEDLDALAPT